jgi:hypothetical protein
LAKHKKGESLMLEKIEDVPQKKEGERLDVMTRETKKDQEEVLDVLIEKSGPQAEPELKSEEIFVSKECAGALAETAKTIDHLRLSIGVIEGKKLQMLTQIEALQERVEKTVREGMMKEGIPEDKLEEYSIEIQTGKIVPNDLLRKHDQKIRDSGR